MARALRHLGGWALLLLGIVGLVLPILQGWLLIGLGALLLAPDVPFFARLMGWVEDRVPGVRSAVRRARIRLGRHVPPPNRAG